MNEALITGLSSIAVSIVTVSGVLVPVLVRLRMDAEKGQDGERSREEVDVEEDEAARSARETEQEARRMMGAGEDQGSVALYLAWHTRHDLNKVLARLDVIGEQNRKLRHALVLLAQPIRTIAAWIREGHAPPPPLSADELERLLEEVRDLHEDVNTRGSTKDRDGGLP